MSTDLATLRDAAVSAVQLAATATSAIQRSINQASAVSKEDRSPVTAADFAAQVIIVHTLTTRFPDIGFIAEESAGELMKPENAAVLKTTGQRVREAGVKLSDAEVIALLSRPRAQRGDRAWVLDPVDGTKGFLRDAQYAIALGYLESGKICAGAMGCPRYPSPGGGEGVVFFAARGLGAGVCSRPGERRAIHVDGRATPSGGRMAASIEAAHGNLDVQDVIRYELGFLPEPLRMDGQGKYGAVACGDAVVYLRLPNPKSLDRKECIWDHAAGVLIVEEAGGRVSDAYGKPLDFSQGERLSANTGIIATTPALFEKVFTAVERHNPAR